MDINTLEYAEISQLLQDKNADRKTLLTHMAKHLCNFSEGVLASVVANYIAR